MHITPHKKKRDFRALRRQSKKSNLSKLVLHLKRFAGGWNFAGGVANARISTKLKSHQLILVNGVRYKLRGTTRHFGRTIGGGHYSARIERAAPLWSEASDAEPTVGLSFDPEAPDAKNGSNYMLWYEIVDDTDATSHRNPNIAALPAAMAPIILDGDEGNDVVLHGNAMLIPPRGAAPKRTGPWKWTKEEEMRLEMELLADDEEEENVPKRRKRKG